MMNPDQSAPARSSTARALLLGMRPVQWMKNAALLAPLVFSQHVGELERERDTLLAILSFCLLSSGVYLANDIADVEQDRLHPDKRLRPLASGALTVPLAGAAAAILIALALALGLLLPHSFDACLLAYLALQLAYNLRLKHVVLLDVFAIAAGFVLRVVAGAVAIAVPVSNWLYLCTMLLALFLALGKRRAELQSLGEGAQSHRQNLRDYSLPLTDQLLAAIAAATILAYALYTVAPENVARFGSDRLKFTIPCVIFGIFRYLFLIQQRQEGGRPERVLLRDRHTQLNLLIYCLVVGWALWSGR